MKDMRKVLLVFLAVMAVSLFSAACFYLHTSHDIHITLDIRHIQQTATNIEDVVSGDKDLKDLKPKSGSLLLGGERWRLAQLLDPSTHAYAEPEEGGALKEMTPALEQAVGNRRRRAPKIGEYKKAGAVGENKLALLDTRPSPLLEKKGNEVRAAVAEENRDRLAIYREIARQNQKTSIDDLIEIQQSWAEVHLARSKPGDWVQVPSAPKFYKAFLRGAIARKLESKPEAGSWIQVPKGYAPPSQ
jgi:uncharacterized protein YdbL (DUF1318 family)